MAFQSLAATPAKLRSGDWGARIETQPGQVIRPGSNLSITSKAGKTWTASVERVIWAGDGVTLVSTRSSRSSSRTSNRGSSRVLRPARDAGMTRSQRISSCSHSKHWSGNRCPGCGFNGLG